MVHGHVVIQNSVSALPSVYRQPVGGVTRKSWKVKILAAVLILLFLTMSFGNPFTWFPTAFKSKDKFQNMPPGPDQIHLSLGEHSNDIVVVWSTLKHGQSKVMYGLSPSSMSQAVGAKTEKLEFIDSVTNYLPYFHCASMNNLIRGKKYYYQIQTASLKSEILNFYVNNASMSKVEDSVRMLFLGGARTSTSLLSDLNRMLEKSSEKYKPTALFQIGDLGDKLSKSGDEYMRELQQLSTRYPFLTVPGNHESDAEFLHYRYRFSMPGVPWPMPLEQLWYSFDIGHAHIVGYSTEIYYHQEVHIMKQMKWLLDDLTKANARRDLYPWIIVIGHRPLYSSVSSIPSFSWLSVMRNVHEKLEDLFNWQGVDLVISAHEQMYERTWPVYKGLTTSKDYENPKAPIHINLGSEYEHQFQKYLKGFHSNDWTAFHHLPKAQSRGDDIGVLEIQNHTHLKWKLVDSKIGTEVDSCIIKQSKHEKFRTDRSVNFGHYILNSQEMFFPIFHNVEYLITPWRFFVVMSLIVLAIFIIYKRRRFIGTANYIPQQRRKKASRINEHHVIHY